jgi:hypothetical protein
MFLFLIAVLFSSCRKPTAFAEIYGVVTDYETNEKIESANVVISPTNASKTTKADGYFEFNELDPQQYTITVYRAGYKTEYETVIVYENDRKEKNIKLIKNN